ncbi:G-type lectin S-receptor-like serine/threonine-protein kinase [Hordeum vulgare]|nr:G-type lectin S-receptor-like serine/threonine-protein kinase [Hordeum vulgare]
MAERRRGCNEGDVIVLSHNDEEVVAPDKPIRNGDPGQGCSNDAPKDGPLSNCDDDDGGDEYNRLLQPPRHELGLGGRYLLMAVNCTLQILLLSIIFLSHVAVTAGATDTFGKGQNVTDGETLVSAGGTFTLGFFSPGASAKRYLGIWFSVSSEAVCWVANRDRPLNDTAGVLLVASDTGDLLLLDGSGEVAWSSNYPNTSSVEAQLLESGNLVVHDQRSKTILWQSFDHPSNTLLPGMKMGKNLWTGDEWYLTSWRSPDDPSPGSYRRVLEYGTRLPEVVLWQRDAKVYRTGPWNGRWFNGVPEASTYAHDFPLYVTASKSEITYGYTARSGAPLTRVVVMDAGVVRRQLGVEDLLPRAEGRV